MFAVRLATMDDAEAVARLTSDVQRLHNQAVPEIFKPPSAELFPASKLATLLENADCVVAVAEIEGKVIGHIYGAGQASRERIHEGRGPHVHPSDRHR